MQIKSLNNQTVLSIYNRRDWIFNLLAVLFFLILFLKAWIVVDESYDAVAYHLPYAARHLNIYERDELIFRAHLEDLYDGHPILGHLLQGLMWRITGQLNAANLVNWAAALFLVSYTAWHLRLKFWLVCLLMFSIPVVLAHSTISFLDLLGNSLITLGFVGLVYSFENNRFQVRDYFFAILPLTLAANVKYQTLQTGVLLSMIIMLVFSWKRKNDLLQNARPTRTLALFIAVSVILALIGGFSWIENWIRQGNPVYPLDLNLGPLRFDGPASSSLSSSTSSIGDYIVSLLELDLWTNNPGYLWTFNGGAFKSGGFFIANLILWGVLFIIINLKYRDPKIRGYGALVALFFVAIPLLAARPQLLRYWMFLPMCSAVIIGLVYQKFADQEKSLLLFFIILQLSIFMFVIYETRDYIIPKDNQQVIERFEVWGENYDALCTTGRKWRLGFFVKQANPDMIVQMETSKEFCLFPNWEDNQP